MSGLEPFADRVALVAEAEGMLPAPVVGHSLGGMVVLRLALRRPNDVTAIVLAAAAGLRSATCGGATCCRCSAGSGRVASPRVIAAALHARRSCADSSSIRVGRRSCGPSRTTPSRDSSRRSCCTPTSTVPGRRCAAMTRGKSSPASVVRRWSSGCRGRAASARGRVRIHAALTRAPAGHPRLRPPADRRASGLCDRAIEDFLRDGGFERHHLPA